MGGLKEAVTKKIGPLPVWVYAIAGAVVVMFFLKSKGVAPGDTLFPLPTGSTTDTNNQNANTSVTPYDPILGGGYTGGYTPSDIVIEGPTYQPTALVTDYSTPVTTTADVATTPTVVSASPAILASKRIDTSNPIGAAGPGTGGGETSWISPIGAVLTRVFGARATELNVGDKSVVQNVNGTIISLSDYGLAQGGLSPHDSELLAQAMDAKKYTTYNGSANVEAVKVPTGNAITTEHAQSNDATFVAAKPMYQVNGAPAPVPTAENLAFMRMYGYPG